MLVNQTKSKNMFKYRLFTLMTLMVAFSLTSCNAQLKDLLKKVTQTPLTKEEVGAGLKEALTIGIEKGSSTLAALDGYYKSPYKILLPEDAQKIVEKLRVVPGFSDYETQLVEKLNRAAEDAAKKAFPIFANAITNMTIGDAFNILKGTDNAATMYLKDQTHQSLYAAFQPVITESLNKVNAIEYWATGVNAYNKIPLVKKMNPKLDDYVNQKALEGLFKMVEKEEKRIRTDVSARTTDLLKKVFGQK